MRLRVLVLGETGYPYPERVMGDLTTLFHQDGLKVLTLVHGGMPTGPDRVATQFVEVWRPWTVFLGRDVVSELHESAWALGPEAGLARDLGMLHSHPDLALAYPGPASMRLANWRAAAQTEGLELTVR